MTSRTSLLRAAGFTGFLIVATLVATLMPMRGAVAAAAPGDKLSHFIAFMALALPLSLVRPRLIPLIAVALAAFGGFIEIVQPWVGRGRELADWYADLGGIAAGAALGMALHQLIGLRRRRGAAAQSGLV